MESAGAFLGLYGGMAAGFLGWWIGIYFAKKKRGIDEVFHFIEQKSRSTAWILTLAAIYVLFTFLLFEVNISAAAVLSIILMVHLGGWGISKVILSVQFSNGSDNESSYNTGLSYVIAGAVSVIFFVASLITGNWYFFIFSLPSLIIVIIVAKVLKKEQIAR
ncbi:hypothetical protein [Metabacillus idriensis]|uniref:hypothetical protein n=1 Tax=Metabacillus idriensis TaxID=324768 RepID=UPI003D28AB1E